MRKKFFFIFALIILAVGGVLLYHQMTGSSKEQFGEQRLLKIAGEQALDINAVPMLTVKKEKENWEIDFCGQTVEVPYTNFLKGETQEQDIEFHTTAFEDADGAWASAKARVCNFIESSEILSDKDRLIEEINKVPAYNVQSSDFDIVGSYSGDTPYATMYHGVMYVNPDKPVGEKIFVHELVHGLSDLTNEKTNKYAYTMLDEIITDAITTSMFHEEVEMSYYSYAFPYIYTYIDIFGLDALKGYFYGMDIMEELAGAEALEFFNTALEGYYNNADMAEEFLLAQLATWK